MTAHLLLLERENLTEYPEGTNYYAANTSYSLSVSDPYVGHAYVDLGLPSGKKWAKCNIGASSESAVGHHFYYGLTKSIQDGQGESYYTGTENPLSLSHDAARAIWGGVWRMPTESEFTELFNNCSVAYAVIGGRGGAKVTSNNNGNYVFFPYGGHYANGGTYYDRNDIYLWTSTPGTGGEYKARAHTFESNVASHWTENETRIWGLNIRPIA